MIAHAGWLARALAALLLAWALVPTAQAHLMVAQRGTLNLVDDGAFMVMSLPVSALTAVDDDGDGRLSPAELRRHGAAVEAQVRTGLQLLDASGRALPLQGLLLQLSPDDHSVAGAAEQIVVLGRFALGEARTGLGLRLALFGRGGGEMTQAITVSRGDQVQRLLLAPGREQAELLPRPWAGFVEAVTQGGVHVLSGPDHLLFLLVVLAGAWAPRQLLWLLSCFTLGHGLTLVASALGHINVAPAIVEPAIAATLVLMALNDRWMQRRRQRGAAVAPQGLRLAAVFGCAMIHGLGLAGALMEPGLAGAGLWWRLAGFNLGIELAQVGVAGLAGALLWVLRAGAPGLQRVALQGASAAAVLLGTVWLVQRAAAWS